MFALQQNQPPRTLLYSLGLALTGGKSTDPLAIGVKREFYLIAGTWGLWCSCAFLAWRMGSGRYPHVQISAHTLGRMLMQPKAESPLSLNGGKKPAADFLCGFGHITLLSVTQSSSCKESSKSSACLLLVATRGSKCSECHRANDHDDWEC